VYTVKQYYNNNVEIMTRHERRRRCSGGEEKSSKDGLSRPSRFGKVTEGKLWRGLGLTAATGVGVGQFNRLSV